MTTMNEPTAKNATMSGGEPLGEKRSEVESPPSGSVVAVEEPEAGVLVEVDGDV